MFEKVFIENARRSPGKTALIYRDEKLDYGGLLENACRIAARLREEGVKRGDIVPIVLPRGVEAIVCVMGVLLSGAAFCFVDEAYPKERIDYILSDTGAKRAIDGEWLCKVDDFKGEYAPPDISPDDPALVVYTSGSTGKPKGVLISHKALDMAFNVVTLYRTEQDVFVSTASFSFVAIVCDALAALYLGAVLHIASDEARKDVMLLASYTRVNRVTTAIISPQMLGQYLKVADGVLRVIMTGSENVRNLFSERTQIVNLYGASETCGPMFAFPIDKPYPSTPIARDMGQSGYVLLGEDDKPVAAGEIGEICVWGQIGDAYLNLPDLSKEKFTDNPASTGVADRRIFRTGDLGRVNGELLEYVQRKDWMVKVRGYRVEPGEIERAILERTSADKAVVKGFENVLGQTALFGVYTSFAPLPPEDVRRAIAGTLPDYMIPAFLSQIPQMPLNANGKIDRARIEPPDTASLRAAYEPPRDEAEKKLCEAFEKALGVKNVGIDDDFSLLGGDSLSAVKAQLITDGRFAAKDIITLSTPRAIARTDKTVIPKAEQRQWWPMTAPEEQMAIEQRLHPQSNAYNVNLAFAVSPKPDMARLKRAVEALAARHEALRSYYPVKDDSFVHMVAERVNVEIICEECPKERLRARVDELNAPFSLDAPPLFRCRLFDTGEGSVLHFCFHHIIIDGASGEVFAREMWKLYAGETLPPLDVTFTDYAAWREKNPPDESGEEYYKELFADGVPENEMPIRLNRPEMLPQGDKRIETRFPATPVDTAAKRMGISAYALLMSAVGLTLGKYCASRDVVVGAAMSGRDLAGQDGMFGMFVNTVPIRLKPRRDLNVGEYARQTADAIKRAKAHQVYPFEKVAAMFAPERNSSRSPIFDVSVNYLRELPLPALPDIKVENYSLNGQAMRMDLSIEFLRDRDGLTAVLSYSPILYYDEVAEGFMRQLLSVINNMASDEKMSLTAACALPQEQKTRLLRDFGGKTFPVRDKTPLDGFTRQARETPDNEAVIFKGKTMTYRELDERTTAIGAHIARKYGVGAGDTVGVMIKRGLWIPLLSIGVLKTGAAYVPLDPNYPSERLLFMLKDSRAKLLIADVDFEDKYAGFEGAVCPVSALDNLPAADWTPKPPKPYDIMTLLYTSGTTGNPKGVMLRHAGLVNFCSFFSRIMELKPGDTYAAYASYGFDAHMCDMYPALMSGARMFIVEEELRLDLAGMMRAYAENGVSAAFLTTQMGRQLVEAMLDQPGTLSGLKTLMVGGETLAPIAPPESLKLFNAYGPTECSIASNVFMVDRQYERVPIGKSVDNTNVYILDEAGGLAPIGVAGELCISGVQVAAGYLNRPDLTKEKFVADPFAEDDSIKMYKTGDVARYLPDGNVDFMGRRDFQVKIRGFRVELTEIERRIREYPGVKDASVQAVDAAGGGKRIVAYAVTNAPFDEKDINAFIAKKLPEYMTPSAIMRLEAIPLTPNGKVNRRALPKIAFKAEALTPASNELEQKLIDLFREILGTEIGANSDVMYAGLSSLSAIRAAAKIETVTGKKIAAERLMREKTVERIARVLESEAAAENTPRSKREKLAEYPLTSNQMGVYYACQKEPASVRYNIPFCVALDPKTDPECLAKCVSMVINAHPYVKTRVALENQEPAQRRMDALEWTVAVKHTSQAAFERAKSAFVRPFTLLGDALARTEIYATPEGVYLLCDFHHIIFDGASVDVFLREISEAWKGNMPETETLSVFDLALEEKAARDGESWNRAKEYYQELLGSGEGATNLPASTPSGKPMSFSAKASRAAIDGALRESGVTRANLFLSATALVVSRVAGTSKALMAAIINGREGARKQNMLGMLVKTLPAVIDVPDGDTALSYCERTQNRMFDLTRNQIYPYSQIAADFNYDARILYAYQGGVIEKHTLDGQALTPEQLIGDEMKFPLSVRIYEDDADYRVEVACDEGEFSYASELASSIAYMAEKLARDPASATGEMSIVSPEQLSRLDKFNRPLKPESPFTLHRLFEDRAIASPNDTALIARDATYTYDALNRRANRLAHALIEKGVIKGDRIAFMLGRTSEVLVAMLGVLKAGGCYIPVDPEYPADRVGYILENSGARFILTAGENLYKYENALNIAEISSDETNPLIDVRADDPCYIIYTSGSTGKPKGVVIRHAGIVNYVLDVPENRHVRALTANCCVMCSVTTVSFDMFLKEAFTTLMNGLTLVLADEEQANNPDKLAKLIVETKATAFNATPSRMLQYLELNEMAQALGRMKVIMAGGESYPAQLYKRLRSVTDAVLINTYGPTEITVSSNGKLLDGGEITVGAPLYNVVERVMDKTGHPLPVGVAGELYIGGSGVALGYYGNRELSEKQFVTVEGARFYKSGDLARWTNDGEIAILGRNDGQVKLRGLRIELGEIENAVADIADVKASAVLVRKLRGQEHLCAYYTAAKPISPETLRERLSLTLTKYMIPTAYLQMDAFPTTPNGKTDRKALPDAVLTGDGDYEKPASQGEADFCRVMGEILNLDSVSATGSFFDMGGHSLLVTRLVIEAAKLGYSITYADVFANPTPRQLAALNGDSRESGPDFGEYDYAEINALLKKNNLDEYRKGDMRPLGNLLITGVTGFLGIHVLREYLKQESGVAYCMIRGANGEKRLMNMLHYYFSDTLQPLFGSRIVVIDGDVTDASAFKRLNELPIDTVINCAANVKHFSAGTDIWDVNVGGVKNAVEFARNKACRLIQISTVSVAGIAKEDGAGSWPVLDETTLYFGQDLSNQYVSSKFMAERIVLEACLKGLDGKIIRVGNLMARDSDGEFQINFRTNNFLSRLRAFGVVGRMSYLQAGALTELAPIDKTAEAILRLAQTPSACRVFHAYNDHELFFSDIVEQMEKLGIPVTLCEEDEFVEAFNEASADPRRADALRPLIAYKNAGNGRAATPVKSQNRYTSQALMRLGFHWPITSQAYIYNFLSMARGLGEFDDAR